MEPLSKTSKYADMARTAAPVRPSPGKPAEDEVDALLARLEDRRQASQKATAPPPPDPIESLRKLILESFVPVFMELTDKYAQKGITLRMDASNLLQGGRSWDFEFAFGEFKICLHGTVTQEAVAFEETRYSPEMKGELASGPRLRLRTLNTEAFRAFVCERLTLLLRAAIRRA